MKTMEVEKSSTTDDDFNKLASYKSIHIEYEADGLPDIYVSMNPCNHENRRSKCRNQAIADMFQYMHIVEAWGTGIPRIIKSCKQYGLQEPVFEEFGDGIKATVYRLQAAKASNKRQKQATSGKYKRQSQDY